MIENSYLIWAGLSIGLSGLWVCLWEAKIAKKALEILGKNPELSWTLMIYTILGIAIVESVAIYGLIIAFKITNADAWDFTTIQAIGAWLSIWLAGLGAWYWEWQVAENALWAFHRNPANKWQVLTFMVLFLALVESAAIYGLITAFSILG